MFRQARAVLRGVADEPCASGNIDACAAPMRAYRDGNNRDTPRSGDLVLNRFTRPHDDACDAAARVHQTTRPGSWALAPTRPPVSSTAPIVNANPIIVATPGYGGPNQKGIDADSMLRIESTDEGRGRVPLHVQSRPFTTVPYMGGGRGNADVESALIHSADVHVERSCGSATELPFDVFVPLTPHLAAHVQAPANLIMQVAAPGWVPGGISSRTLLRDMNC